MINDFFNLIFPRLCAACELPLYKNEKTICTSCQIKLPKSNYHLDSQNPIQKIFWGRVKVEMASSYYLFSKKSKVQHLLHQLKYNNNKEVGLLIGKLYGYDLLESAYFKNIDYIIPVPLHPKKLKRRGFNQSEYFAKGLSDSMKIPIETSCLYRKVDSQTQTKKSRFNRWENVGEIFDLRNTELIKNKNILLVDDVVTTGATLEACAQKLQQVSCKIFITTIASA